MKRFSIIIFDASMFLVLNVFEIRFWEINMNELSDKLNIPANFTCFFKNDSDWGTVMKLSAMLEMAVIELIAEKLSDKKLTKIVRRAEFADVVTGKMAYVKELELLPLGYQNYLDEFIRMQFWFTQDVNRMKKTFNDYQKGAPADVKFVICLSKIDMDACHAETDANAQNEMMQLGILYGAYKLIGVIEKEVGISIIESI